MAQWAVIIPADRWATERLFHHDTLSVAVDPGPVSGASVAVGDVSVDDEVLVVAGDGVVALAQVVAVQGGELELAYVRRAFDEPVPAAGLRGDGGDLVPVEAANFRRLAATLGGGRADKRNWLVSVALPIEAATPADAVRQFWSHVLELGPVELPTYVWPSGDELAMQAFVLGEEANQDPEEDDED